MALCVGGGGLGEDFERNQMICKGNGLGGGLSSPTEY